MIPQRRFDFTPLEEHFRRTHRHDEPGRLSSVEGATVREMADILGIGRGNLYRYRNGGLPTNIADRFAIRIGIHPVILWPDFYNDITEA